MTDPDISLVHVFPPTAVMKNRGGAPRGNQNARKHGIYAKFILLKDQKALDQMSGEGLQAELALARACLKDALERKNAATDPMEKATWDAASHAWFESVVKIKLNAAAKAQQVDVVWDTFQDALRHAWDVLGVK
jgi:hypothetical protein